MLAVATILVIALIVATVLVSIPQKKDYAGELKVTDVIKGDSINYSLEAETAFRQDVSVMLSKMLTSFFDSIEGIENPTVNIKNSVIISSPLISIFSKAAIPTDKLLAFGEYLKNIDSDEAIMAIWLYFIRPTENPDGTITWGFANNEQLADFLVGKVDFMYALKDIVSHTALTAEEAGRLIYELIRVFADEEQRTVLAQFSRGDFVSLFVSATTVYESYVQFNLIGGTLAEARTLGELAFQMGAELQDTIESVGIKTILKALYLANESTVDDEKLRDFLNQSGIDDSTLADIKEANASATAGIKLAEFVIYFFEEALMTFGNAPFEALAMYHQNEGGEENNYYMQLYKISLASTVCKAIDVALQKGEQIKNRDQLVTALANFKLTAERLNAEIPDEQARLSEIKAGFNEYIDKLYAMNNDFGSIIDVDEIRALSNEDKLKLKEYVDYLDEYDYASLTMGMDDMLTTLSVNIMFNVIADTIEEAISEVK